MHYAIVTMYKISKKRVLITELLMKNYQLENEWGYSANNSTEKVLDILIFV